VPRGSTAHAQPDQGAPPDHVTVSDAADHPSATAGLVADGRSPSPAITRPRWHACRRTRPPFDSSLDLNADADLIAGGIFIDIKAGQGGKPSNSGDFYRASSGRVAAL
jgi:hypothetical protein